MFFNLINQLNKCIYSSLYYSTCVRHWVIQYIQKPGYRYWNYIFPPINTMELLVYCTKTKTKQQLAKHNIIKTFTLISTIEHEIYITSHKLFCSTLQDYQHYNLIYPVLKLEESNVRFLGVELQFKTTNDGDIVKINIDFDLPFKYNYYIVGNKICARFIDYFIHTYHPIWVKEQQLVLPIQYNMVVIDDNITEITLTEKDAIILKKKDYEIVIC